MFSLDKLISLRLLNVSVLLNIHRKGAKTSAGPGSLIDAEIITIAAVSSCSA